MASRFFVRRGQKERAAAGSAGLCGVWQAKKPQEYWRISHSPCEAGCVSGRFPIRPDRIFGAVQTEKMPSGRARGFVQRFPKVARTSRRETMPKGVVFLFAPGSISR